MPPGGLADEHYFGIFRPFSGYHFSAVLGYFTLLAKADLLIKVGQR
jgi:hypothetical protein